MSNRWEGLRPWASLTTLCSHRSMSTMELEPQQKNKLIIKLPICTGCSFVCPLVWFSGNANVRCRMAWHVRHIKDMYFDFAGSWITKIRITATRLTTLDELLDAENCMDIGKPTIYGWHAVEVKPWRHLKELLSRKSTIVHGGVMRRIIEYEIQILRRRYIGCWTLMKAVVT